MLDPRQLFAIAIVILFTSACASAPLSTEGVDADYTVADAHQSPADAEGRTVIWSGVIARAQNLETRTRIEVVGYPMDERTQRPRNELAPIGRFLVYVDGYVETAELPPGRRLTVRGQVDEFEDGRIGDAEYRYPVVTAENMELWPQQQPGRDTGGTRFHFGIGILFSN